MSIDQPADLPRAGRPEPGPHDLMTPAQACRHLPRRRGGRPPHVATIYRWMGGSRGVKLDYVQVGGTRCVTLAGLYRFFDELKAAKAARAGDAPAPPSRTPSARARRWRPSIASSTGSGSDRGPGRGVHAPGPTAPRNRIGRNK